MRGAAREVDRDVEVAAAPSHQQSQPPGRLLRQEPVEVLQAFHFLLIHAVDHVADLQARALARAEQIKASGRYIPAFLDLMTAVENSRLVDRLRRAGGLD